MGLMLRAVLPALVLALLLAPAASAGYTPALYYLAPPDASPLEGNLSTDAPEGDVPSAAFVTVLPADAASASFIALEDPNATHVLGRVLVGLWADLSAAQGAVEARFVLVEDGVATPLASATRPVSTDPAQAPEPTALLPPDPTDPQGAVFHAAAQAMPLLARPPVLLDLGVLDVEVPEGAVAGIELRLVEDNATGLPASGFARVSYAAATAPSFLYVPWWSADEPAAPGQTPAKAPSQPGPGGSSGAPGSGGSGGSQDPAPQSDGKDSPAAPLVLVLAGLAAVAVLRRRS